MQFDRNGAVQHGGSGTISDFYPEQYMDEEAEALGRLQEEFRRPEETIGPMTGDRDITEADLILTRSAELWCAYQNAKVK